LIKTPKKKSVAAEKCLDHYDRTTTPDRITNLFPMAVKQAHKYFNSGVPVDDLVQLAMLGLCEADARFDSTRGLQFSTYAMWYIRGRLSDYFRKRHSRGFPRLPHEYDIPHNFGHEEHVDNADHVSYVLSNLSYPERVAIEWTYLHDQRVQTIADHLDCSKAWVYELKTTAKRRFL
jgi:RNA polymerase sigma factor (sigma-70 family)